MQKVLAEKYSTDVNRHRRIYRDLSKMRILTVVERIAQSNLQKNIVRNTDNLNELDISIKMVNNKVTNAESKRMVDSLTSIVHQQDRLIDEIEMVNTKNEQLKSQIRRVDDQLSKYSNNDTQFSAEKKLDILESQLLHKNQKLSCLKMDGLKFKEIVSRLLFARQRFQLMRNDFIAKLLAKKQKIIELVDHYSMGFLRGMESCRELEKLNNQTAEQLKDHLQDMRQLIRSAEATQLLCEFMIKKEQPIELASHAVPPREILMDNYRMHIKAYADILAHLNDFAADVTPANIRQKIRLRFSMYLYINDIQKIIDDAERELEKLTDEQQIATQQALTWQNIKAKLNQFEAIFNEETQHTHRSANYVAELETKLKDNYRNMEELFKMLNCEDSLSYSSGQEINAYNFDNVLEAIEKRLRHVMYTVFCWQDEQNVPADERLVHAVEFEKPRSMADVKLVHQCPECSQAEVRANPEFEPVMSRKTKTKKIKMNIKNKVTFANTHAIEDCPKPGSKAILSKEM